MKDFPPPLMAARFSTGLFACFADLEVCCLGLWCWPCLMSRNSVNLDGAKRTCCNVWCCGCYPATTSKNRAQALATFGIREGCCKSCCIGCCCPQCSDCQVAREINLKSGIHSRCIVNNNGIEYADSTSPQRIEMDEAPRGMAPALPPKPPRK